MKKIRIVAPPPGEAPQLVRDAWIGLVLPLAAGWLSRQRTYLTAGVLSGPRTPGRWLLSLVLGKMGLRSGYAVNALEAVNVLAERNPKAAAWWHEHCAEMLDGKRHFVFPADVCMSTDYDAGGDGS